MAVKKHKNLLENNVGTLAKQLESKNVFLFPPAELISWCKSIVVILSKAKIPSDPNDLAVFHKQIQHIEEYLKKMVNQIEENWQYKLLFSLLKKLYDILCTAGPSTCPAASIVLNLSPVMNIGVPRFVSAIVSNEDGGRFSTMERNANLQKALTTLCNWLCYWDGTPNLHHCIISFMKALEEQKKYDILFNVSSQVLEKLFNALENPSVRTVVVNVFLYILASTRDSVFALDKIAHRVPRMLSILVTDTSPDSRSVLQNIIEALTALLNLHPECMERYADIVVCFESHIKSNSYIMDVPIWEKPSVSEISTTTSSKVGLYNLGNTCYMNSALQALLMTKQFSNGIVMSKSKIPIICKLKSLFVLMLYAEIPSVNPIDLFSISTPRNFSRGTQQDSSEFLCYFLNTLNKCENDLLLAAKSEVEDSSDCSEVIKEDSNVATDTEMENSDASDDSGRKRRPITALANAETKKRKTEHSDQRISLLPRKTIVEKVFGGLMSSTVKCLKCGVKSIRNDTFFDINLSFPVVKDNTDFTVTELLDLYWASELLTEDNRYMCDVCSSLQDAEKSVSIESAPKNLILVLKQFLFDEKQRLHSKLFHRINVDRQITVCEQNVQYKYNLYAVIIHSGSAMDTGHYYTIAKDTPNNWYVFDDEDVRPSTEDSLNKLPGICTPYILFYEKVNNVAEDAQKASETPACSEASGSTSTDVFETFNPSNDTIPFEFLPAYLVDQIKKASKVHPHSKRLNRHRRWPTARFDDDQPGSSTQ